MGILDDAIRQHLDLKRRLGAEDEEIQRLESEAFGPPTRPGEPDFPETGEAQAVAPETGEQAQEPAETEAGGFFDQSGDEPAPEPEPQTGAEPPSEEHVAAVPFEMDDPAAHLEVLSEPARVPEPEHEPAPEPQEPPIESLDTVEHHFEGAVEDTGEAEVVEAEPVDDQLAIGEEPPAEGEEDVLEETPEFLRDQPEDDELWFEQGEPKDFDF
jgi:hypothetical protein